MVTVGTVLAASIALVAGVVCLPKPAPPSLEAAVLAAEERVQARNRGREPAWGEMTEGIAFEHYAAAVREQGVDTVTWDRRAVWSGGRALSGEELQAHRVRWAPVLEKLCRGAHCRDAEPQPLRDGSWMALFWLGSLEAKLRLDEARWLEAVRLWLDVATFLVDLESNGCLMNHCDVLAAASWDGLPHDAAATLAEGLARIESRIRRPLDPMAAMVWTIRPQLDGEDPITNWHWPEILEAAEWGFDPSARHLDAFAELLPALAQLEPPAATEAAREAQWRALVAVPRSIESRLVDFAVQQARDAERAQRRWALRLRELRLALERH